MVVYHGGIEFVFLAPGEKLVQFSFTRMSDKFYPHLFGVKFEVQKTLVFDY